MSRRRLSPTQWFDEGPSSAHFQAHSFSVHGVSIPDMRPILVHGQTMTEARREQAREAARRYRARAG